MDIESVVDARVTPKMFVCDSWCRESGYRCEMTSRAVMAGTSDQANRLAARNAECDNNDVDQLALNHLWWRTRMRLTDR